MIDRDPLTDGNQQTTINKERTVMTQEINDLLAKVESYKQIIQDARDALEAALEDLEEALNEEYEDEGICSVSPFQIVNVTQSMGEVYGFGDGGPLLSEPRVRIEGQLYDKTRILEAVDLENISYEEIMNLIGG